LAHTRLVVSPDGFEGKTDNNGNELRIFDKVERGYLRLVSPSLTAYLVSSAML
jgi:hypothetical protein